MQQLTRDSEKMLKYIFKAAEPVKVSALKKRFKASTKISINELSDIGYIYIASKLSRWGEPLEEVREKLNDDVLSIWRKTNKTVLFVTHNISESVYMSDRICVLSPHPGRLSAIVDVNLPRPRNADMRGTPEFAALVEKVRNSFEGI